ncbi:MAG: hypothetical protein QS721_01225 [Candidatus Endonucleobacter sp. (ex Gigantidas childressi)]|nr:hypothetical protein [Candidatus Endonucleobacter sp. (ex Gigantidas childressi)]
MLGWSPKNISFRMKVEVPGIALNHTTTYKRVATNKVRGGSLYKNLPRFGKRPAKVVSVRLDVSRSQTASIFPICPQLLICGLV